MKLVIFGGRDFTDIARMEREVLALAEDHIIPDNCELVCGMAPGADRTAHKLWTMFGNKIHEFFADWNGPLGKGAGFARNRDMAAVSDRGMAFWDGKSRGTAHMIRTMESLNKPLQIHYY